MPDRRENLPAPDLTGENWIFNRFGTFAVGAAMVLALATFTVFAGFTPITPTANVVTSILLGDSLVITILVALIVRELLRLRRARKVSRAGARLQARVIGVFALVAAIPAIVTATVATVSVEWAIKPGFLSDVAAYIRQSGEVSEYYREFQCQTLLQQTTGAATELSRASALGAFNPDMAQAALDAVAAGGGFRAAAVVSPTAGVLAISKASERALIVAPGPVDFNDARESQLFCPVVAQGTVFAALRPIEGGGDTFLYTARSIDPASIAVSGKAAQFGALFFQFDDSRQKIELGYAVVFVMLALTMLFSAIWLGLRFATQLVTPIRRLIRAADEVASGNLSVQVPARKSEGDLGHLSHTFNKMTQELRLQRKRLTEANTLADERRAFIEAALSGVPAGVLGVDVSGAVTVINDAAQRLLGGEASLVEAEVAAFSPPLAAILEDARAARQKLHQSQFTLLRSGRERIVNVRVTTNPSRPERGSVVTLDDITDLVMAQRTSAWADVARRIAHEIKNPLTPIQLSAERLKRRYGKMIVEGKDVFDQCTDTIIRQVDDIKRMVDEFSSFARMPRARPMRDDLRDCVRQGVFLARVGRSDITFDEHMPSAPFLVEFDRRLISQALTNLLKNAGEGIDARGPGDAPLVVVSLTRDEGGFALIGILDNGRGFPAEDRHRLLEPYVTTRTEGTGLGLPIVKKICEDHRGALELSDGLKRSDGGFGAQIVMRLPPSQNSDAASPAALPSPVN